MSLDCCEYVKICAESSLNKKPCYWAKGGIRKYLAGAPLERIHLDILGVLLGSNSGNTCILVIVDQFTKWVECFAIPHQKGRDRGQEASF